MKKLILGIPLFFLLINYGQAQTYGNFQKVPVAFTIIPPLSTNGSNAGNCVNQLSFNLISGYSGGLAGFEFGGIANTERDFVRGAQFAGFLNFVNGEFTGFQYAGFANFNRNISRGFQFAGFANFNYAEANGMLFSGFANFTNGKSLAIQMAGFANFCEDVEGVQLSGFSNVVKGNGKVAQFSGFSNIILGEVDGVQIAGFLNFSKARMQNFQAAGFMNISMDDAKGIQLAGFSNITNGNLDGAQISGFLNVARKLNGLQLGIINLADTIESGVPIGILSIVKHGFREFEVSFSEGLNAQATFKIGVDKFYNIFTVGNKFIGADYMWGFGYGIGTRLINNEQLIAQLELISYHINEGSHWTNSYNDLQQARLTFSRKVNRNFSVFAGPTINLMISENRKDDGHRPHSLLVPYSIYSYRGTSATLDGWVGLTAGIRIN
ncbi:MAG TPA: hypothetical protein VKA27_14155 [Sunxiuqinia sp.]|nr:hypothetical protein [Sunxiuqinia sp.]